MNLQDILKRLNEQTIMLTTVACELNKINDTLKDELAEPIPSELINDGKD